MQNLIESSPPQVYPADTEIYAQDTPAVAVYFIEHGIVKLSWIDRAGRQLRLTEFFACVEISSQSMASIWRLKSLFVSTRFMKPSADMHLRVHLVSVVHVKECNLRRRTEGAPIIQWLRRRPAITS